MPTDQYLVPLAAAGSPRARLVCFPQAGAGAAAFRRWPENLRPGVDLLGVRLPGHESLFEDAPLRNVPVIGRFVAGLLARLMPDGVPTALFGYCSGAFAAFETARALCGTGTPPALLAVCAQVAPQAAVPQQGISTLPTPQLKEHIRVLGGTDQAVMDADELWELIEPGFRADYEAVERYEAAAEPRLSCDILGFYGAGDRQVRRRDIEAWGQVTTAGLSVRELDGQHLLLESGAAVLLAEMTSRLLGVAEEGTMLSLADSRRPSPGARS